MHKVMTEASTKQMISQESTDFSDINVVLESKQKKTKIGLFDAICFIYGNIIGSGIFISVSETFNVFENSSLAMVIIFWIFGSFITLIGAFCYAELGIRYPSSGGECIYFKNGLHKKFSILFVIMFGFVLKTIVLAATAVTASKYFIQAVMTENNYSDLAIKMLSVGLLLICFYVNCISKVIATKASVILTLIKTAALFIIIGFGCYYLYLEPKREWVDPFKLESFNILNLGICFINIFWSFEGWNTLGLIAGDVYNPQRNLPISIGIGVSSVSIMYLFTIISYSVVLGFDLVRKSETVALVYSVMVLKMFYPVIPVMICFSCLGTINGTFYSTGTVLMSAAYQDMIPRIFSLVFRKSRTPVFALTTIFLASLIFIPLDFQILLQYCAFVTWFFYFLSFTCLWIFKIRDRKNKNPGPKFSINYVFVLLLQLVCLFVIAMSFYLSIVGCSVIAGIMLVVFFSQFIPFEISKSNRAYICYERVIEKLKILFDLEESNIADIGGES